MNPKIVSELGQWILQFKPQNGQQIGSVCQYSRGIDAETYLDVIMCSWFMERAE